MSRADIHGFTPGSTFGSQSRSSEATMRLRSLDQPSSTSIWDSLPSERVFLAADDAEEPLLGPVVLDSLATAIELVDRHLDVHLDRHRRHRFGTVVCLHRQPDRT